ncbi:WhiB family transcriptional regulator [Streptomyces sp. NBC_01304]|uniref:WhiB family transcriptional regulator n=1 Tax=Streptomyces sp. NBC_01304 TaxID=2903818 RepID=UPI002E0F80A6|nr:WhiB family transcriptional regulator [Streptomyces sp. NBC_01304]
MITQLTRPNVEFTACADADPEIFHDDVLAPTAKQLCAGCPLAEACRTQARNSGEWGTWGGETSAERAAAGYPPVGWTGRGYTRFTHPCGTPAAYQRHMRAGETACEPCKQAESVRAGEQRARRRLRRKNNPARTK